MNGIFKNECYCRNQILLAREAFGSKNTTEAQYDAMEKCLGMIYLHGPESVMSSAYATLQEAEWRRSYFMLNIWNKG